ncbi:hypothetical protein MHAE_05562 [Mycobacterium haemophilum DSM 44634]
MNLSIAQRTSAVRVGTSSTDAIAATTTPGAVGANPGVGVAATNLSMISPAKTAGMSSTPAASNQSNKTCERSSSRIGSRL